MFDTFVKITSSSTPETTGITSASPAKYMNREDKNIPGKWKNKIELIKTFAFEELNQYIPILEEENGDLECAISRIISLEA
jgi:hypothetical protein